MGGGGGGEGGMMGGRETLSRLMFLLFTQENRARLDHGFIGETIDGTESNPMFYYFPKRFFSNYSVSIYGMQVQRRILR